jgi:hypothetical protein
LVSAHSMAWLNSIALRQFVTCVHRPLRKTPARCSTLSNRLLHAAPLAGAQAL